MLSGLKTRSLGLNTLGTMKSPASSQSVQDGRPSTASWVQPVLSKVNVTCSRPQRNVHQLGFEPGTPWSEIRHPNHCATLPPQWVQTPELKVCYLYIDTSALRSSILKNNIIFCTIVMSAYSQVVHNTWTFGPDNLCYYICAHFAKISFAPIIHLRA